MPPGGDRRKFLLQRVEGVPGSQARNGWPTFTPPLVDQRIALQNELFLPCSRRSLASYAVVCFICSEILNRRCQTRTRHEMPCGVLVSTGAAVCQCEVDHRAKRQRRQPADTCRPSRRRPGSISHSDCRPRSAARRIVSAAALPRAGHDTRNDNARSGFSWLCA